jgi:molybdenum cofactor biosynthesis protein MoaC
MNQGFHMIDVGGKSPTHRNAIAEGRIVVGEHAFSLIRQRALPKGDVLMLAEIAGIQGAKTASQLMPLCHPMGLDQVQITTVLEEDDCAVRVFCTASTHAKTGVEMEALAGANAALLTIWDLTKMVEPDLLIEGVRLLAKSGGKSGLWLNPAGIPDWVREKMCPPASQTLKDVTVAIITLSDRAAAGIYEDKATPVARALLERFGATVTATHVIPDEPDELTKQIHLIRENGSARLIITTGGTGIAPRDKTPETISALADRIIPGIGEQLRLYGSQFTPFSWSSRSIGATFGNILIITLPGNPKAVREGIECLHQQIPHLINTIDNLKHD